MIKLIQEYFQKRAAKQAEDEMFAKQYFEMYKKYRLVGVLTHTTNWTWYGEPSGTQTISYILKENGEGDRTYEIVNGESPIGRKNYGKETDVFVKLVKPWVEGLNFNDVPTADEVRTGKRSPYCD